MGMRVGAWKAGWRMGMGNSNSNDIRRQTTTGCAVVVAVVRCRGGCGRALVSQGEELGSTTTELAAGLRGSLRGRIPTVLVLRSVLFFCSLVSRLTG